MQEQKPALLESFTSNTTVSFLSAGLRHLEEERKREKMGRERRKERSRTRNTNVITPAAQVITGVERSPAGPEANELLSPSPLPRGTLLFADCRGALVHVSPTSHQSGRPKHWSLVSITCNRAVII